MSGARPGDRVYLAFWLSGLSDPKVHIEIDDGRHWLIRHPERTGALEFPYAWRLCNMMAVSDRPIVPALGRLATVMASERVHGQPAFDPPAPGGSRLVQLVVDDIAADLEPRDRILARTRGAALITDDNMGTEWRLSPRYRAW